LLGRGPCQRPSTSSCQVAAQSRRWTVCRPQPRWRAISRRPRPSARSPWTRAWCRRVRSAYFPAGSGCPAPSGSGRAGPCSSRTDGGAGSARQARWAATHFSAALARFCHRWNLSATWTACDAPVLAPSTGGLSYWNCPNTLPGRGSPAVTTLSFLDALEEDPPIASTIWRADPASEGIALETRLVRRPLSEGPKRYTDTAVTW
jgi:hypothetical protein